MAVTIMFETTNGEFQTISLRTRSPDPFLAEKVAMFEEKYSPFILETGRSKEISYYENGGSSILYDFSFHRELPFNPLEVEQWLNESFPDTSQPVSSACNDLDGTRPVKFGTAKWFKDMTGWLPLAVYWRKMTTATQTFTNAVLKRTVTTEEPTDNQPL